MPYYGELNNNRKYTIVSLYKHRNIMSIFISPQNYSLVSYTAAYSMVNY